MAPLSIHSLATVQPPARVHHSLLGSAVPGAYHHLYEPAGNASRPPTVRRGVTSLFAAPYSTSAADDGVRVGDLASEALQQLLAGAPGLAPRIGSLLNAQCTLDQQILGSTCLRLSHDHLPDARRVRSIGQLGTAALPAALRLASLDLAGDAPEALSCVSACDKWIAPFYRHVPGVVRRADAAAACLVGPAGQGAIATIEAIASSIRPFPADLWRADPAALREHVAAHAASVVVRVMAGHDGSDGRPVLLVGDLYEQALHDDVLARTGLALELCVADGRDGHLSTASPLFALSRAIAEAVRRGTEIEAVIWTSCIAGHAGALRVRCRPDAVRHEASWRPAGFRCASPLTTQKDTR